MVRRWRHRSTLDSRTKGLNQGLYLSTRMHCHIRLSIGVYIRVSDLAFSSLVTHRTQIIHPRTHNVTVIWNHLETGTQEPYNPTFFCYRLFYWSSKLPPILRLTSVSYYKVVKWNVLMCAMQIDHVCLYHNNYNDHFYHCCCYFN